MYDEQFAANGEMTMKTTVFALAALLASSGMAFAGNAAKPSTDAAACTTAQIQSGKVDCAPTGSIGSGFGRQCEGQRRQAQAWL